MIRRLGFALACLLSSVSHTALGATLQLDMNTAYTGATPGGSAPFMTAIFDDLGGMGSVKLTLDNANLLPAEFVSEWYFNLDPALDPGLLVFSAPIKSGGNGFDDPGITKIANGIMAPGDGSYDFLFSFATSNQGGGARRFGMGEKMEVTISGIPTLTASSFNFLSAPGGGNGPYPTAAHVQGIVGPIGSGHVTVPEPSTLAGTACLTFLVAICFRKRWRNANITHAGQRFWKVVG